KLLILRSELDLSDFAASGFGCRFELNGFTLPRLLGFLALVKTDRCLEHQEDVVTRSLNLANCSGDAIGVGQRFVNRVSEFLHALLESIFQNSSSFCAALLYIPSRRLKVQIPSTFSISPEVADGAPHFTRSGYSLLSSSSSRFFTEITSSVTMN